MYAGHHTCGARGCLHCNTGACRHSIMQVCCQHLKRQNAVMLVVCDLCKSFYGIGCTGRCRSTQQNKGHFITYQYLTAPTKHDGCRATGRHMGTRLVCAPSNHRPASMHCTCFLKPLLVPDRFAALLLSVPRFACLGAQTNCRGNASPQLSCSSQTSMCCVLSNATVHKALDAVACCDSAVG
jgi:hypothetical protein